MSSDQKLGGRTPKATLRIRESPGSEPAVVLVRPEWSIGFTEAMYARAKGKSPMSVSFTIHGKALQPSTKVSDLPPEIRYGTEVVEVLNPLSCDGKCERCVRNPSHGRSSNVRRF